MKINDFQLERYFGKHEFTAKYLLSSSDCDGYEMQYVLDVASKNELKLWEGLTLGYTESEGHALLREAILQYYKIKTIENVVVASPGELNFIAMNVLLQPTDHVISISPSYQSLYEVVNSLGCELSYWKPNPAHWKFEVNDLKALIKENTKLIIINFPHNPTGGYLTKSELMELVELARQHDIYIFSDEMYHKLIIDAKEELPPISDLYEKGISLWGTSKTFGLAGLRIGWLVSQDLGFIKKVIAFKDYLSICNNAPGEILTIIGLNHIDHFLQPNLQKIKKNISLFEKFVNEHKLIDSFIRPQAGSTSFVKLNINESALTFSNNLVEATGIMTVPAEMFRHEEKYIRIGFGRNNFNETLEKLSEFLNLEDKNKGLPNKI